MMTTRIMSLFQLLVLVPMVSASRQNFPLRPDSESTYENPYIASLVNLSDSQYDVAIGSSYWSSTYLSGNDGHQYMVLSHILTSGQAESVCRSSVLRLGTWDYWKHEMYCAPHNITSDLRSKPMSVQIDGYGFVAKAADSISSMATFGSGSTYSYNISFDATTKPIFNGGNAIIGFGPNPGNATEWSLPACRTTGTLTLNNTEVAIDPHNSFTWYDRQISHGIPQNWTWFQLHFPRSSIKASIWAFDYPDAAGYQTRRFATVRADTFDQHLLAYDLTPSSTKTWTSPDSNITYPLAWTLQFKNGDHLSIESVRPDQELYGAKRLGDIAYEGFIKVSGSFMGQNEGYGLVEVVKAY